MLVRITSYNVCYTKLLRNERQMITTDEIEQGYVLACYQNLVTNIVVEIEEQNAEILSDFDIPKVKENKYSWIRIDGLKKRPEDSESAVDLIAHHLGKDYNYSLSALRKLSNLFNQQPFEILERDERHVSDLRKESGSFYGIGIDIGTTTLALALIDFVITSYSIHYTKLYDSNILQNN